MRNFENEYGYRAESAIFKAERFNVPEDDLSELVKRVKSYIENIFNIPPYKGDATKFYDTMTSCGMETLQEQLLRGEFAFNETEQEQWNARHDREDLLGPIDSRKILYF